MPYRTNDALPPAVRRHLPPHAQDVYREAFNHAFAAHAGDPRQEEASHRIAWADYLVLAMIVLSLSLVVHSLIAFSEPPEFAFSIAAGACAATSVLMLAYPFAILGHYRIEIGV